jgi:hypothetical protein
MTTGLPAVGAGAGVKPATKVVAGSGQEPIWPSNWTEHETGGITAANAKVTVTSPDGLILNWLTEGFLKVVRS